MKISKSILAFLCAFSIFLGMAYGQASGGEDSASSQTAISSQALPDESSLPIADTTAPSGTFSADASEGARSSTLWLFFRMLFALVVVAGCVYLVMNFFRKKMGGSVADDDTFLRKVAQVSVAPGKTVQIVTLLEKAYLIGVTDNSIDLLGEINDRELVDAMNLNADRRQERARARNFNDILSLFLNPKNPAASAGERKASSSISDFFKKQKEKFNNEG